MNVGRLAAAARVILKDFNDSKIIGLIGRAVQLAAQRSSMDDGTYQQNVAAIQAEASAISQLSLVNRIPTDIVPLFIEGDYKNALPVNLAKTLLMGVTKDKVSSMSSAELSFYQESAHRLVGNLNNMVGAFKALNLDEITVPDEIVSVDLLVPRAAFDNKADVYLDINQSFVQVYDYIQELVTDDTSPPELVYTSTTNPVIGFGMAVIATTPFFIFYEKVLDVAKKQIELIKLVRSVRELLPGKEVPAEHDLAERVRQLTHEGAQEAVKEIGELTPIVVDDGRKAEITNALSIRSTSLVTAIANGARISVSLESQITLEKEFASSPEALDKLNDIIELTRPLEQVVAGSLKLLNENVPLLQSPNIS